jgi:superfamily I DNA and/or RNA helicase
MLTKQARMHEDISRVVSKMNYDDKLGTMNIWQSTQEDIPLPAYPRLTWIATHPEHQFKIHKAEAKLAVELAMEAFNQGKTHSIGIITPFRSQIALIQSLIPEHAKDTITVDTVERFQGSERDLIIISLAIHSGHHMKGIESRTEINGEIIDRKLNVALTRARKQCIILGAPTALEHDSPYHALWSLLKELN